MTPDRDRLDAAIDDVAARMVHVEEDAALALRIADALPERSRVGWWIPQLATVSALAVALVWWSTNAPVTPPNLLPSRAEFVASLPLAVVADEPGSAARTGTSARTMPLERLEPLEPLEPFDHARSLPSLTAMNALMVSDLTPEALPAWPALTLAPIGVTELPLTAESLSQKED